MSVDDEIRVRMLPDEILWLARRAEICVLECLAAGEQTDKFEPVEEFKQELRADMLEAKRALESVFDNYRSALADLRARLAASERELHRTHRRAEHRERRALTSVTAAGINAGELFDPAGCFVYILWGTHPQIPVYVGESTNILGRLGSHLGDRNKRPMIFRVQLIRCTDEESMHHTEARLIAELRPRFNVVGQTQAGGDHRGAA